MSSRAHISDKVGLAAALLQLPGADIPLEHAKLMTADQIISLFHRDHWPIRKEAGGPDEPWNLHWKPIMVHREKTAKIDIPEIAKGKRLRKDQASHNVVMAVKAGEPVEAVATTPRRSRAFQSRPFPKQHRPMRSRNNFQRRGS